MKWTFFLLLSAITSCSYQEGIVPVGPTFSDSEPKMEHPTPPINEIKAAGTLALLSIELEKVDFGVQSVNSLNSITLLVKKAGAESATSVSVSALPTPFKYKGGSYPGLGGTCGNIIDSDCTLVVAYEPKNVEKSKADLELSYFDGEKVVSLDVPILGEGSFVASLQLSLNGVDEFSGPIDFGVLSDGQSIEKNLTVLYAGALAASELAFMGLSLPFEVVSTTCGVLITSNCQVRLRFTAMGSIRSTSQTLKLTYNNGSYTASYTHEVSGGSLPLQVPALLTITDPEGTNTFGGRSLIGSERDKAFNVLYSGTFPATVTSANIAGTSFNFKGGIFPGAGGTCQNTISANCIIVITFTATSTASVSGVPQLSYQDGSGSSKTTSLTITGQGGNPALLTISPATSPHNWGTRSLGTSTTQTFTIANASTNVDATSVSVDPMIPPFSRSTTCTSVVKSGTSCTVSVSFKPTASGDFLSTLGVNYHNGNSSALVSLPLQGTGSSTSLITASIGTSIGFGKVVTGVTVTQTVTLNGFGTMPISFSITDPVADDTTSRFSRSLDTCASSTLTAASRSCSFKVNFSPDVKKMYSGNIRVTYPTGSGTSTITINLTGEGVDPGILTVTNNPFDFGGIGVGASMVKSFTLSNSGGARVPAPSFSVTAPPFSLNKDTCSSAINPGSSCNFKVTVSPTVVGPFNGSVTITYNNGASTQMVTLNLSGTGIGAPFLVLSGGDFGKVPVGSSAQSTVTVLNSGTADTSLTVSPPGNLFSILQDNCSTLPSLAVGASCPIQIQFSPATKPGLYRDSLTVNFGAGRASLILTGSGTVPVQLSSNGSHTCARTELGEAKCWGNGGFGQLGLGVTTDQLSPPSIGISLGSNRYVKKLATGFFHTCALLDNDALKCWGRNSSGQLGLGDTNNRGDDPNEMGDALPAIDLGIGQKAVDIVAGYAHTCVLLYGGVVKCFGFNGDGQLGLGDTNNRGDEANEMGDGLAPIALQGPVKQLAANTSHTCALLRSGNMQCFGNNFFGQLGLGDTENRGDGPGEMGTQLPLVDLGTGKMATTIATGGAFTVALLSDGSLKAYGRNDSNGHLGALWCQNSDTKTASCSTLFALPLNGIGIYADQMGDALPVIDLGAGIQATSLVAGTSHVCASLSNGKVKCWGNNDYGQLGLGDTRSRGALVTDMGDSLPILDLAGKTINALHTASFHTCALFSDQTISCWGDNRSGQLGTGDTATRGDEPNEMGRNLPFLDSNSGL